MKNFFLDLIAMSPGNPQSSTKVGIVLGLGVFLILLFFITPAIRRKISDKALKKVLGKLRGGLIGFGLCFLLLVWFRMESVPLLSMRLWAYLAGIAFLAWCVWKLLTYRALKKRITQADARRLGGKTKHSSHHSR
ncbi:hypothetical protein IPN35_06830 [Candidatus Peregrinibacteria bacterium]|nr:MAG: hypothetical protein IPN35_06830 [Candidatus Peregrinibacteria bacterium]